MENASKALIIAGAILIAILLISVGILVMQSAGAVVDEGSSKMNEQAIQIFNAQFINYSGEQRGSTVKQLMQTVITSNAEHEEQQVKVTGLATEPDAMLPLLKASTKYKVEVKTTKGIVTEINVTKPGGTTEPE